MGILKTVIGSYPCKYKDFGLEAIDRALKAQLDADIDLVSDGQTRYSMIDYFAEAIDGVEVVGKRAVITSKIGEVSSETMVHDLEYVRRLIPEGREVKGILTGPTTLAMSSKLDCYQSYLDRELYIDLAEALRKIAMDLQSAGASSIQVDEPFISVGVPMDLTKEVIELIAEEIRVPLALHVCGEADWVIPALFEFENVNILSFASAVNRKNLSALDREKLESWDKMVGIGCIDTASIEVETAEEVCSVLQEAERIIGRENMIAHPDCGLGPLDEEIAYQKLLRMKEGVELFNED